MHTGNTMLECVFFQREDKHGNTSATAGTHSPAIQLSHYAGGKSLLPSDGTSAVRSDLTRRALPAFLRRSDSFVTSCSESLCGFLRMVVSSGSRQSEKEGETPLKWCNLTPQYTLIKKSIHETLCCLNTRSSWRFKQEHLSVNGVWV